MKENFLLAPMAEISHRAFRELVAGFGGCGVYYSEMISAGAFAAGGGPYEHYYADNAPYPAQLVYQIVGGSAERLAEAAALLDQRECLGVDVNMGCSAPAIVRTGGGVAWLRDTENAIAMIGLVRKRVTRRLSVKLRTGFEDDFNRLADFCKRLAAEGVEQITLHPRTAREKFKGRARWDYVAALRSQLDIPVAGNGDIGTAEELNVRAADGAAMIGRLAVQCPWVFAQAAGLPLPEKIDLLETAMHFLDLLEQHQPPEFHTSRALRFFTYFCENLTWKNHVRTLLGREKDLAAMRRVLSDFFEHTPEERYTSV